MRKKCHTSVGQSKELLAMGADPATADLAYISGDEQGITVRGDVADDVFVEEYKRLPAWSFQALLDLIPKRYEILINRFELKNGETEYTCKIYHTPLFAYGKTLIEAMVNLVMQIDFKKNIRQ